MGRVQLFHHVYSSVQGYQTLRSSPEIPAGTVEVLVEFSEKTYPKARQSPRVSVFPPDEVYLCLSMNVLSGVDHVGRKRSLVHNILLRREEIQAVPGFNHMALPHTLFMKAQGDLQRDVKVLPQHYDFTEQDLQQPPQRLDKDCLPRKCVLNLLRLLLGDRPSVVRSEKTLGFDRLVTLSGLLPAVIREPIAIVNGTYMQELQDLGNPTVFVVPQDFDLAGAVHSGLAAVDEAGGQGYNLPRPHPWERFVVGHLTAGDPNNELATLVRIVNRYRPIARYTPDAFERLALAFQAAKNCFEPDGRLNIKRAPSEGLNSASLFFEAGHADIVFDIFLGCLEILGVRDLWDPVRKFGEIMNEGAKVLNPLFQEAARVSEAGVFDFDDD